MENAQTGNVARVFIGNGSFVSVVVVVVMLVFGLSRRRWRHRMRFDGAVGMAMLDAGRLWIGGIHWHLLVLVWRIFVMRPGFAAAVRMPLAACNQSRVTVRIQKIGRAHV